MLLHIRTKNETHLTSLLEMLKFSAADWNEIIRELDVIHHAVFKAFQHGDRNSTITSLRKIQESCGHLGLTFSSSYVDRIVNLVMGMVTFPEMRDSINEFVSQLGEGKIQREMASKNNENFGPKEFENEIDILKRRIDDELQGRDFFALEQKWAPYFYGPFQFGDSVFTEFPEATKDIEEAGKCLALERGTACVFHLMRVMESGLKQLAKMLNIPYAPSWESYLKQIRDKIEQKHQCKGTQWKKEEPFFKELLGHIESVKIAWRNPTMHIVRSYDVTEAEQIFNSVKFFMQKLADKQQTKKAMRGQVIKI